MKFSHIFVLLVLFFFIGCTNTTKESTPPVISETPSKLCKIIVEEKPSVKEQCGDVSFTEPVCSTRKLAYNTSISDTNMCVMGGDCFGKPIRFCAPCAQALSRCSLSITNLDKEKSGSWTVVANFTFQNFGFNKEPITRLITPNETFKFDFSQVYTADTGAIEPAVCHLLVISEPKVFDCHEETRTRRECKNITEMIKIEKEVCS